MNRNITESLAGAGGMLVATLSATLAYKLGYIDQDTVTRVAIGVTGLWMAWYGNRMAKTLIPNPVPAGAHRARRVASWCLVVSGLIYAGLWAFAPIPVATVGGCGAIVIGIAVTFGYCLSLRDRAKDTAAER